MRKKQLIKTVRSVGRQAVKTTNTTLTGGFDVVWRSAIYNLAEDIGGRIIIMNPAEKYWLVNKCINHIAEKLAQIEFAYQDDEGNPIEDGDLIVTTRQPNPHQDWWDFILRSTMGWCACKCVRMVSAG